MARRNFTKRFGTYIKKRRLALGMTLGAFSGHSAIPKTTLFSLEAGRGRIAFDNLVLLARAFGHTPSQFVKAVEEWL